MFNPGGGAVSRVEVIGTDPLERVVRPVVEGQIGSFINDHPKILEAVDWFKPRKNVRQTLVSSIAKRIVLDLLCAETRVRLVQALVPLTCADAQEGPLHWDSDGSGGVDTSVPVSGEVASLLPRPIHSGGWQAAPASGLEAAIAEFKAALPGWWFTVGECQVSADASCAPTAESSHVSLIPRDRRFDDGFHADLPQPATLAEALADVTAQALAAIEAAA
jgi:hypothetical protein